MNTCRTIRASARFSLATSYTIVSLKLDFKTAREGGMAVSAVWRLV